MRLHANWSPVLRAGDPLLHGRKHSLLLVNKSDLLVSISLLLVSKCDFFVAAELASFSGNPSTLRRPHGQARGSTARVTPKATTFFKSFTKDVFFDPSRVSHE